MNIGIAKYALVKGTPLYEAYYAERRRRKAVRIARQFATLHKKGLRSQAKKVSVGRRVFDFLLKKAERFGHARTERRLAAKGK